MAFTQNGPAGIVPNAITPSGVQVLNQLYQSLPDGWVSPLAKDWLNYTNQIASGNPSAASIPNLGSTMYALLVGIATAFGLLLDGEVTPSKPELRLATMDGFFLDAFGQDFYGSTLLRPTNASDAAYRALLQANIFAQRPTYQDIFNMLLRVTGRGSRMQEAYRSVYNSFYAKGSSNAWQTFTSPQGGGTAQTFGAYYSGSSLVTSPNATYGLGFQDSRGNIINPVDRLVNVSRYSAPPYYGFVQSTWPAGAGYSGNAAYGYGSVLGATNRTYTGADIRGAFFCNPVNFANSTAGYTFTGYIGPPPFDQASVNSYIASLLNSYRALGILVGFQLLSGPQLTAITT